MWKIVDISSSVPAFCEKSLRDSVLKSAFNVQRMGVVCFWRPIMDSLIHWLQSDGDLLAVLVTVAVALLLVCCLECSHCPERDKDDLFRRRAL
jgi:hypothetical protein